MSQLTKEIAGFEKREDTSFKKLKGIYLDIGVGLKLLSDLHDEISNSWKIFINPQLSYLGAEVAKDSIIDDYLYGADYSERFKKAKDV